MEWLLGSDAGTSVLCGKFDLKDLALLSPSPDTQSACQLPLLCGA